jgi:integrase
MNDDNDNKILQFPARQFPHKPPVRVTNEPPAGPMVTTLPPKVALKDGRYYYRDKGKWHGLTRADEGASALYTALQAWTSDRPATYGQLMILFVARGMDELELKPATRPEYMRQINGRLQHHFGHMLLNTLEATHIAQYLQLRKVEGAPKGGNRERATLSSIISWGMRYGWCAGPNPCYGVRRNKETPSKVYVEDAQLKDVIDLAPPCLRDLLAVGFLSGLRQGDLRILTRENITDKGIELIQSKDKKYRLITWSAALSYFVEAALARSTCEHVFVSAQGRPYTMDGLQNAMKRLKAKCGGSLFKFRELRPKAASDATHNVLGHGAQMLGVYVRAQTIKPVR